MDKQYNLVTILGPTACGKTRLAALLADQCNGEIISCDSRQVYRHMDIGTGKDLQDYIVEGKQIPVHLIDIVEPSEEFSLFHFQQSFSSVFKNILEKNKTPFLAGGTGMYLSAVLEHYKLHHVDFNSDRREELEAKTIDELQSILLEASPNLHNTTDLLIKERIMKAILIVENDAKANNSLPFPEIHSLNIGVTLPREMIKKRITSRLKVRLENGMVEEVEALVKMGISHEKLRFFGLEYKYISMYLRDEISYSEMFRLLNIAIHQFSKRQMTWFRRMEKQGVVIHWIEGANFEKAASFIKENFPELKRGNLPVSK